MNLDQKTVQNVTSGKPPAPLEGGVSQFETAFVSLFEPKFGNHLHFDFVVTGQLMVVGGGGGFRRVMTVDVNWVTCHITVCECLCVTHVTTQLID